MSKSRPFGPDTLNVIRLALLAGVMLFGLVAWIVRPPAPANPEVVSMLGWVALGLVLASAAGLMVLRRKIPSLASSDDRARYALIGYALCEGATLMGGVVMLMGGSTTPYVAGLITFLASLSLLSTR